MNDYVTLDPGIYFIGDPCYVFNTDWITFLEAGGYANGIVDYKG